MKTLLVTAALLAGAYFIWTWQKANETHKREFPNEQAAKTGQPGQEGQPRAETPQKTPQKTEAELKKEAEDEAKKKADEAAAQLKAEAEKQAKDLDAMKNELSAKKEEWRKLNAERKKWLEALKEGEEKGWQNTNALPERQGECKAACDRLAEARRQAGDAKDKVSSREANLRRASSVLNSSAKSRDEMQGWRYTDESPGTCRPMSSFASRDKKRTVKYIEGKGMSNKQTAEISKAQAELDGVKNEYTSAKARAEDADKEFKAACEKYMAELKSKASELKTKMREIRESGKTVEAKLAELSGEASGDKDDKDDD